MEYVISFAGKYDEKEVVDLLADYEMGMSGDIEEYVVIRIAGQVGAVGKLLPTGSNIFHLEVLGVRNDLRRRGIGGLLLSEMMKMPWKYCCSVRAVDPGPYRVTILARGEAESFYEKQGLKTCSFSRLPPPYDGQCDDCPDLESCSPLPMIFEGKADQ